MGFETTYIGGKLVYNCSLTAETHILNDINIFLIYIYINIIFDIRFDKYYFLNIYYDKF